MTSGEIIRKRRLELGMTQEELAKKAGTKKQTVYKYETGIIKQIPAERLYALAGALELSPNVFGEKYAFISSQLKQDEQEVLNAFRAADEATRKAIVLLLHRGEA